jgi:hypothetical protein
MDQSTERIRSGLRLHLLAASAILMLLVGLAPIASSVAARAPVIQSSVWTLTTVEDWEAGSFDGLLVVNNADGELRLAEASEQGVFVSAPFEAEHTFNAVGATWQADMIVGTGIAIDVRVRSDAPSDAPEPDSAWSDWLPLRSGDARAPAEAGAFASADVLATPVDSRYLQLRVRLDSEVERASAVLEAITIDYIDSAGTSPIFTDGLPRLPLIAGPVTLTPRPSLVARTVWSGATPAVRPERQDPQGIVLHQIDATTTPSTTVALLRALDTHQVERLGWEDLAYHYIIDEEGNLFEGRIGGPTARVERLAAGDSAVHIALITPDDADIAPAAQGVLVNLLAWLGEAYDLPPTGTHTVVVDAEPLERPNIVVHADIVDPAPDPAPALQALMPQLRRLADESTVRARWYFAEGNVADYSQRLSFYNPTDRAAEAQVTFVRPGDTPIVRVVPVPASGRADLVVNDVVSATAELPAIVESSAPILAERSMGLTTDIDGGPGIDQLSRVWYFAEGSTRDGSETYLILFNPQAVPVGATVSYMRSDGTMFEQEVQIGGQSRLVVAVHDLTLPDGTMPLANTSFGMRVIARQPIAAERTLRFGSGDGAPGLHTGRGIRTLARTWYFAEGTTEGDFQMRLMVLNPNSRPANTTVVFMGPDGRSETRRYAVPPQAQLAIDVNEVIPDLGISTMVEADRPVAVERALVFNSGRAGTIGAGAIAPRYDWAFVDGRTNDASYFLCVSNPNQADATVTVDFRFADGAQASQSFRVEGNARYTMAVHELYPNEAAVVAIVRGTQPIVAERSIYPGGGVRGGLTSIGLPLE